MDKNKKKKLKHIQKGANHMASYALERSSLKDFIKQNKEKIYTDARDNTKYNSNGQATISKDDPSFNEDEWEEHFKRMDVKNENR